MAAIVGSLLFSINIFAANGADPEGVMPFAINSTGTGVSFAVNNGDADESKEHYLKNRTFTTDANLRFNRYTSTNYFQSKEYNDGTYTDKDGNSYPAGYNFKYGDTIDIDNTVGLKTADTGYHLYSYERKEGKVHIDYWTLTHYPAQCIHGDGMDRDNWNALKFAGDTSSTDGHGYVISKCGQFYNNITRGWSWTCAECGTEKSLLHYMTPETASNFYALDNSYFYYYVCPFNGNIEQASGESHYCKEVSPNRYYINYKGNGANGYMSKSTHLYDNGGEYGLTYEGKPVSALTSLKKNTYTKDGAVFAGWNTKQDGTGQTFSDEQEIFNLTSEDEVTIILYAQWEPREDYLTVTADDGNGHIGTYDGNTTQTYIVGYEEKITVEENKAVAPIGYEVQFDADGGIISGMENTRLSSINGTIGYTVLNVNPIEKWDYSQFLITNWDMDIDKEKRIVTAINKNSKIASNPIIRVTYSNQPFSMPYAKKNGSIFVGWEITSNDTGYVYASGENVYPSEGILNESNKITFKALYGNMSATVIPDYQLTTNDGDGAVDIEWDWNQNSAFPLYYKVYEGNERGDGLRQINLNGTFELINIDTGIDNDSSNSSFTVITPGRYTITASGAKGSSTSSYEGGNGRTVSASIYLNEGDQIIYEKVDGGSSTASDAGGPGGSAEIVYLQRNDSTEKSIIIIAGGGGAATSDKNGVDSPSNITTILETGSYVGENGQYGGGAGNKPGIAGSYEEVFDGETTWDIPYIGEPEDIQDQEFKVPVSGTYKLEVWGAQGGGVRTHTDYGGMGGYSYGNVYLTKGQSIYIVVGGRGSEGLSDNAATAPGGYNGGADGHCGRQSRGYWHTGGSGGGATHIATVSGVLSSLSSNKESVLIVAGGGGGAGGRDGWKDNGSSAGSKYYGGSGGGITGNSGDGSSGYYGGGGTQTEGGNTPYGEAGTFGAGGRFNTAGGGGGWYGGGGSYTSAGAGGGSGYISSILTNASTSSGINEGDGRARITLIESDEPSSSIIISLAATGGISYYNYEEVTLDSTTESKNNSNGITITGYTYEQDINTGIINSTADSTFTVTTPGNYTITTTGSKGSDLVNGSYAGGNGRSVSVNLWLNMGDKIIYSTLAGGNSSSSEAGGSGGSGRIVYLQRNGSNVQTVISIAAGGGAATLQNNGGAASATTTILYSGAHTGENGTFGGGAGNTPGGAGADATAGGTSYYNSSITRLLSDETSSLTSATITITGKAQAISEKTYLYDWAGDDREKPEKMTVSNNGSNNNTNVDLTYIDYETNIATISISKPIDNGTTYTYFIEGYKVGDLSDIPSVVTDEWAMPQKNNIATGIAGYQLSIYNSEQFKLSCTEGVWSSDPLSNNVYAIPITSESGVDSHLQQIPNKTSDEEVEIAIPLQTYKQYVYISAYDFAENYSEPCLLEIPAIDTPTPPEIPQNWPVYTNKLMIHSLVGYNNVYKDPSEKASVSGTNQVFDIYYVKADGETSFDLEGKAYNSADAMVESFYINTFNYSIFPTTIDVLTENPSIQYQLQTTGILTDSGNAAVMDVAEIKIPYFETPYLQDVSDALYRRYLNEEEYKKIVSTNLSFVIEDDFSGVPLFIYPEATGYSVGLDEVVYSNKVLDIANGLVIIPDIEGPSINVSSDVLEAPGIQTKWDPDNVPEEIIFDIEDLLSGVAPDDENPSYSAIKIMIKNNDSGTVIEYPIENISQPGSSIITIPVEKDNPAFSGTFTITIEAVDNVGNETKVEYEVTNYTSESYIEFVDMAPADETDEKFFATLDNGKIHVKMTGYVDDVIITAPECITFTDSDTNIISISYNGDSTADVIGHDFPLYKTDTEISFVVSGKLDSDQILDFKVEAIKDGETKVTYLHADYKKDELSIIENGVYSTETNVGIENVYHVPTSYRDLLSGMITGDHGNSYFVKADTFFTTKHKGNSTLPIRKDAVFDKMYLTAKNISDNIDESIYSNEISLEKYILDNVTSYYYRYFKFNDEFENTISFNTTNKDIISPDNDENSIIIENYQSFDVTNYVQKIDTKLTWSAPGSMHGDIVRIVPRITIAYEQNKNMEGIDTGDVIDEALYIIPDAKGPVIGGADQLNQSSVSPDSKKAVDFTFTDDLSGYHHAEISINNVSNNKTDYYYVTDAEKQIIIDPSQDLWLGVINITVVVYDNVGNSTQKTYTIFTLNVKGTIMNTHEPYTNVFYSGNRGWLYIETIGYADSIDVTFPDDIHPSYWIYQEGDHYGLYEYEKDATGNYVLDSDGDLIPIKNYNNTDESGNPILPQSFTIPLSEGEGYDHNSPKRIEIVEFKIEDKKDLAEVYEISIIAHKNEMSVSDTPFLVIKGYSGDLWRTRLR